MTYAAPPQISAELREIEPACVLDFYVHESYQRQGIGKQLFEVGTPTHHHAATQMAPSAVYYGVKCAAYGQGRPMR